MFRSLLLPVSALYAAVVKTRAALYGSGWLASHHLDRPVLSVGNLTLGGTGKTPFVAALARVCLQWGLKPAVLSRGYRRASSGVVVVSAGAGPLVSRLEAGDEPFMLARELPRAAVVVADRRYQAGLVAERELGAEVHILDDGFQHLSLHRTLDLLLVDASVDLSRERVLPAGRLREGLDAMARAGMVILTRSHLGIAHESLRALIRRHNATAPIVSSGQAVRGWRGLRGGGRPADALKGRAVLALASIGRPQAFFADLERTGARIVERLEFRDHHPYTQRDVARIARSCRRTGAELVATTLKDLVRLEGLVPPELEVMALETEAELPQEPEFGQRLRAVLEQRAQ